MSTIVLARKYRPPNFDSLVGQEHVVQALANALTRQRLHHAYLFTGTRGVGKTTISRILAKSLNCTGADGQGGITARCCGVCSACTDIDAGRFVDYVELDAASNRGVEEISQLLDQAVYKPVLGRFKVYMIDEVHMLSNTAFNAMLKTLEEPPEYLKFVLATTDPQKVPPTVLSRCLQFNLRPMAPQTVQEHLEAVLAQERIDAEPGALRLLSRAARGSMRDALSLADQAIAFGAGRLDEAGVRQMLGAVDRGHVLRIVRALAAGDGPALVAAVDGLRALGLSAAGTLEEMAAVLQQMAVVRAVPAAADAADPEAPAIAGLAARFEADETQLFYSIALHGRAELGLAPDEYSGLVMVLLRMLAFRPHGAGAKPADAPAPAAVPSVRAAPVAAAAVAMAPVAGVAVVAREVGASTVAAPLAAAPLAAAPLAAAPGAVVAPAARNPLRDASVTRPAALPAAVAAPPAARVAVPAASEPPPWLDAPSAGEDGSLATLDAFAARASVSAAPAGSALGGGAPVERHEPPPAAAPSLPAPPGLVATPFGDRWAEAVARMQTAGSIGALVRELAVQAECVAIDDVSTPARWRLRVEREMLRAPALREKLQAALADSLNRAVLLELEAGVANDSPARRDADERARRQADAEQIIADDPLVRALMARYQGARIVPGSVKPH